MTLKKLFCEGIKGGPDSRILQLLIGERGPEVTPLGDKYGLGNFIRYEQDNGLVVLGIRDRDFDRADMLKPSPPQHKPVPWVIKLNEAERQIGWYWERVEVENYLIDPALVQYVFPRLSEYPSWLEQAADHIAVYTAARMTLSFHRIKRRIPHENHWGDGLNLWGGKHFFPQEITLREAFCLENIRRILEGWNQKVVLDIGAA
jgi:hypothetical protein